MGKLAEWNAKQRPWVSDALHRAATNDVVTPEMAGAVFNRVACEHGLKIEGEHPCQQFDEKCLQSGPEGTDHILLCSLGPVGNIDQLAPNQQLKFNETGITLIFGENGSGKSGYARALRRLSRSRIPGDLHGNIYAGGDPGPATVEFSFRQGEGEATLSRWTNGDEKPRAFANVTFLDTANAQVYVEGETEILYLPAEVRCLTALGRLYSSSASLCHLKISELTNRYSTAFGANFNEFTTSGRIISRLSISTSLESLPSAEEIRANATWTDKDETELNRLHTELAQSPQAQAMMLRRIAASAQQVVNSTKPITLNLSDDQLVVDEALRSALAEARNVAKALSEEQIGRQPIEATGSDTWRILFHYAREFAEEAGIISADTEFSVDDPCPLCQRPLDEPSQIRLNAFDNFLDGQATKAITDAEAAVALRIEALRTLNIMEPADVEQRLTELSAMGKDEAALAAALVDLHRVARIRRLNAIANFGESEKAEAGNWAPQVVGELSRHADSLIKLAEIREKDGGVDTDKAAKHLEMQDKKNFHAQLDELLARQSGLDERLRYQQCADALNTRPVSNLASSIRSEIVTPTLQKRITEELAQLGIGHIPLRFREGSKGGQSFFEMALATPKRVGKSQILSEGEQRAMALACFLADSHVAQGRGAIIVDDPVTSLDHQRLRRVAQRFVREAGKGRQVIIFTHNLLFYQEVIRASAENNPPTSVLPCLVQSNTTGFGLVSINDQPWIAKRVQDRVQFLEEGLKIFPANLPLDSDSFRRAAKDFYTDLRETWERAVEQLVLGGVVERFGSDVKTQSLKQVEVSDEDYRTIFFAMKRASERSGHDQAAGRQIDIPDKSQMEQDLKQLTQFIAARRIKNKEVDARRKQLESPPIAMVS